MRVRPGPLVAFFFVTIAFSGCFGGDDETTESPSPTDATGGAGNGTVENATVMAVIVVSIDGNETSPVNGSIPAVVGANLTFDGSDSEGTNLTYAWDFGDDATGTNAMEVHAYAAAGLFNVTLTAASGNDTSSASVLVNVTLGGPQKGDLVWTDKKTFSGSLPAGNPNAAAVADVDYRDHTIQIVDKAPDGTPAMARRVKIVLDGSGASAVDMYLYWRRGTTNLASSTGPGLDKTLSYEGDMPAGPHVVRVRFATGANAQYTVNVELNYFAT